LVDSGREGKAKSSPCNRFGRLESGSAECEIGFHFVFVLPVEIFIISHYTRRVLDLDSRELLEHIGDADDDTRDGITTEHTHNRDCMTTHIASQFIVQKYYMIEAEEEETQLY
jgi:hypothetical protein